MRKQLQRDRRERKITTKRTIPCDYNPRLAPFGHCSGCFGVQDGGQTHYAGSVEHPFTELQATNYETGREIDAISRDI